jgi:hypothetical protein
LKTNDGESIVTDVLLVKRYPNKVLIVSNTDLGKKWMEENLVLDTSASTLVSSDGVEDIIKMMEAAEVTYEF